MVEGEAMCKRLALIFRLRRRTTYLLEIFSSRINMKLKTYCAIFLVTLLTTSSVSVALADEGMWTFNNVPKTEIKKRYGFDVTDDGLKKVQLASVRATLTLEVVKSVT